jgi:hypothetical protein
MEADSEVRAPFIVGHTRSSSSPYAGANSVNFPQVFHVCANIVLLLDRIALGAEPNHSHSASVEARFGHLGTDKWGTDSRKGASVRSTDNGATFSAQAGRRLKKGEYVLTRLLGAG